MRNSEVHIGNETYSSKELRDMCRNHGISMCTYIDRRRSGWSHEEAISTRVGERYKAYRGAKVYH